MLVGAAAEAEVVGHGDAVHHLALGVDVAPLDGALVDGGELGADLAGAAGAAEVDRGGLAELAFVPLREAAGELVSDLLVVRRDDDERRRLAAVGGGGGLLREGDDDQHDEADAEDDRELG